MNQVKFEFLADFLRESSGLVLTKDKLYLLDSRLLPLAYKHGMKGVDELIDTLEAGNDKKLAQEVTDAMTTNETFFFRDVRPFDLFRDTVLPRFLESRSSERKLRIWCTAASTGQEPYTLAMILDQQGAKLEGWRTEILATDIAAGVLDRARSGLYSQFEVQRGLPIKMLVRYFKKKDDLWEIDPALKAMVRFREFNLLDDPAVLGRFDIVFCRNVLIYLDPDEKRTILKRIRKLMPADGVLFLGGAETVLGISEEFMIMPDQRGIYHVASEDRTTDRSAVG